MSSDEDVAMNDEFEAQTMPKAFKGKGKATEVEYPNDENLPWYVACSFSNPLLTLRKGREVPACNTG